MVSIRQSGGNGSSSFGCNVQSPSVKLGIPQCGVTMGKRTVMVVAQHTAPPSPDSNTPSRRTWSMHHLNRLVM